MRTLKLFLPLAAVLLIAGTGARASDPHAAPPADTHSDAHSEPAAPMALTPHSADHAKPPAHAVKTAKKPAGKKAAKKTAPAKKTASAKTAPPAAAPVAAAPAPAPAPAPHAAHWGYDGPEGPEHWGAIKAEYKTCGTGLSQSPIDIDSTGAARMEPLAFHYKVSIIEMVNNGHTIQANYGAGSYITVGTERYDLLQFHFHTPSEHRVAGRSFPMEIHFVHRNARGQLAVVGVLIAPGESNLAARELWDRLPAAPNSKSTDTRALMNARDLLPNEAKYFRYSGSLTTPPCSEQVNWFVLQQPVAFSIDQIARAHEIMGDNARPTQARNGRYLLQAVDG